MDLAETTQPHRSSRTWSSGAGTARRELKFSSGGGCGAGKAAAGREGEGGGDGAQGHSPVGAQLQGSRSAG